MNNIKETPEYKLSKIAVIKKLYEDKYEANNVIADLSEKLGNSINKIKELEEKNASNGSHTNNVPSGALAIELEPCVENDNNFNNEIAELKSQIEGHFKINNELQQENEKKDTQYEKLQAENDMYISLNIDLKKENEELKELKEKEKMNLKLDKKDEYIEKYKEENKVLKEKLCHIEATMKAFSVLVNMSVN